MNKFLLRSVVFSTFLIIVCGGVAHNEVRAKPMALPVTDMVPHMSMTKLRPLAPGDQARADAILAAAKKAAERYRDYRKAEADGYTIFMPDQRQNVYHFIRESSNLGDKERRTTAPKIGSPSATKDIFHERDKCLTRNR
jgi:hypothetical protein